MCPDFETNGGTTTGFELKPLWSTDALGELEEEDEEELEEDELVGPEGEDCEESEVEDSEVELSSSDVLDACEEPQQTAIEVELERFWSSSHVSAGDVHKD